MRLPDDIGDYLTGETFDPGLRVRFVPDDEDGIYRSRQDYPLIRDMLIAVCPFPAEPSI